MESRKLMENRFTEFDENKTEFEIIIFLRVVKCFFLIDEITITSIWIIYYSITYAFVVVSVQ